MRDPVARLRAVRDSRREGDDQGFTLVEMLVSMIIFSLAIALVFQVVVRVQSYTRDIQTTADASSELRQALAVIDRQVRSGNVLFSPANEPAQLASCTASGSASGSCMRVYTQANGLERCVQWQVIADPAVPGTNILRSRSWSPTWQTDGNYSTWAVEARGLVAAPSRAAFTLQGATTASSVRFLQVHLEAKDARRPDPVVITSSLSGRNTNYGYDAGVCSPAPPA